MPSGSSADLTTGDQFFIGVTPDTAP